MWLTSHFWIQSAVIQVICCSGMWSRPTADILKEFCEYSPGGPCTLPWIRMTVRCGEKDSMFSGGHFYRKNRNSNSYWQMYAICSASLVFNIFPSFSRKIPHFLISFSAYQRGSKKGGKIYALWDMGEPSLSWLTSSEGFTPGGGLSVSDQQGIINTLTRSADRMLMTLTPHQLSTPGISSKLIMEK